MERKRLCLSLMSNGSALELFHVYTSFSYRCTEPLTSVEKPKMKQATPAKTKGDKEAARETLRKIERGVRKYLNEDSRSSVFTYVIPMIYVK